MFRFGKGRKPRKDKERNDEGVDEEAPEGEAGEEQSEPVTKPKKKNGRKIWGFYCAPRIKANAILLAKQLNNTDLYVLAEHAVELGLADVAAAIEDPEERENLLKHFHENHVIPHLVESMSKYDKQASEYIRESQILKFHKEQAIRDLVEMWTRYHWDPRDMKEVIMAEGRRRMDYIRSHSQKKE